MSCDDPVGMIIVIPSCSGHMATLSGQGNMCISAQQTHGAEVAQACSESTGHLGS